MYPITAVHKETIEKSRVKYMPTTKSLEAPIVMFTREDCINDVNEKQKKPTKKRCTASVIVAEECIISKITLVTANIVEKIMVLM